MLIFADAAEYVRGTTYIAIQIVRKILGQVRFSSIDRKAMLLLGWDEIDVWQRPSKHRSPPHNVLPSGFSHNVDQRLGPSGMLWAL